MTTVLDTGAYMLLFDRYILYAVRVCGYHFRQLQFSLFF